MEFVKYNGKGIVWNFFRYPRITNEIKGYINSKKTYQNQSIKAAFAKLRSKQNNEEMNFDKYATMGEIIAHLVAADGFAFR